jgi:ubiquitin carboxyl-terminal hydrolase 2/21
LKSISFISEETLDGDEKPTCGGCKTRTRCLKWYSVERWPKILVVHLKRFAGSGYRSKLSGHVDVPVEGLDLR